MALKESLSNKREEDVPVQHALELIERAMRAYTVQNRRGDHTLNPGMETPPPYRAAAVLILLIPRGDGLTVLFTERTTTLPSHPGQISFPGGGIDAKDSSSVAAALREAQEEIGLAPENVRVLGVLDEYVTRTGYLVHPVVGVLEKNQDWKPNPGEVAHIFEVPLAHIMAEGNLACETVRFEDKDRRFYVVTWQHFRVWGATAGMLRNFTEAVSGIEPAMPEACGKIRKSPLT